MEEKISFSALRIEEAIEKKEYKVEVVEECGCSSSWYINDDDELVCDRSSDNCGIWAVLVVDGKNIVDIGLDDYNNWDLDVAVDWSDMDTEDWRKPDLQNEISDILLDYISTENPGCVLAEKESLVEFLVDKKKKGYILLLSWPRNFDNEYSCMLAEPGAKKPQIDDEYNESYDEVSPERWAGRYLERNDDATDYSISFELIESNNFYLRELKDRKGLTNKKLADLAGISIKTVESWFADPASKSYKHMRDITLKGVLSVLKDVDR